jgi:hypothetical protein
MRIMLYGSTQIQHVRRLFERNDIEVVDLPKIGVYKTKVIKVLMFLRYIKNVDIVYKVYTSPQFDWFLFLSKLLGKTTITHWIGTDVLEEKQYKNRFSNKLKRIFTDINLAGSSLLKEELHELGIQSVEIPIVPSKSFSGVCLMPATHSVLVYAPEGKESFYGMEYVKLLAQKYPQIKFHIVANSNDTFLMANVIFHGKLSLDEMNELYNKTTILFRYPKHDGLSMMLIEALSKGKYVVYPYTFPFVNTPKTNKFEDIQKCFEGIINNTPIINSDASQYINKTYSDSEIFKLYKRVLVGIPGFKS